MSSGLPLGESLADTILPERYQTAFVQAMAHFLTTGEAPFTGQLMERTVVNQRGEEMQVEMTIGLINTANLKLFNAFVRPASRRP